MSLITDNPEVVRDLARQGVTPTTDDELVKATAKLYGFTEQTAAMMLNATISDIVVLDA